MSQSLGQSGHFDCLEPIILHLAGNDMHAEHERRMASADLILAQATAANFPIAHLQSARLRARLGERVIVWPNMFYSGQQPFARYITLPGGERLLGPLEAVHDLRIFWDWWQERHGSDIRPQRPERELVREISALSLRDLLQRETNCDIPISDVIQAHSHNRRLFFTFNHPTRFLIDTLCDRILSRIGLPGLPASQARGSEPLDRYVIPSSGFPRSSQELYTGNPVLLNAPERIAITPARQSYSLSGLRTAFFQCYDHMAARLNLGTIRVTPDMPDTPFPLP
ncbi:MAG: hypothetical protein COW54_06165 [Rhodobacteraceae bacterium CG17_big_fil_post_rev_8_21_14_2_50_63_15]|nr:hypothetical protein [Roseovarius sp.]PIV79059.1 MAG: hypothetical protein COW54_06165 [Rhodobacteraceae bacterium CG17_big_fil_post_rev_8_21_14_2_50_63_15]